MTKLRNYEFSKYYVIFNYFQGAVSALFWLSQFCNLKKKIKNRLPEYSKIRQFHTYQIAFLMRNKGDNLNMGVKIIINFLNKNRENVHSYG